MSNKIVIKVAYLKVCSTCGLHGFVVLADGCYSEPLSSKSTAVEVLESAERAGRVSPEEVLAVREQIFASEMANCDPWALTQIRGWVLQCAARLDEGEREGTVERDEDGFFTINPDNLDDTTEGLPVC